MRGGHHNADSIHISAPHWSLLSKGECMTLNASVTRHLGHDNANAHCTHRIRTKYSKLESRALGFNLFFFFFLLT